MEQKVQEIEVTPEMTEAGAERLWDFCPDCDNFENIAKEIYLAMERSKQHRAGDAQAQKIMDDLYAEVRELRAELEAANGYIRSLESRCAMQARQLGYG